MNKKLIIKSLAVIVCIVMVVILGVVLSNNSMANEKLTKENYNNLIKEYGEKHKNSDNAVYLSYAIANYMFKDGMSVAFNMNKTEEEKEQESYKNIYGKTIKTLVNEGKELMKENNMTVEGYKESLKDLSNSINDINN